VLVIVTKLPAVPLTLKFVTFIVWLDENANADGDAPFMRVPIVVTPPVLVIEREPAPEFLIVPNVMDLVPTDKVFVDVFVKLNVDDDAFTVGTEVPAEKFTGVALPVTVKTEAPRFIFLATVVLDVTMPPVTA
jgi:hypothetical protein